MACENKNCGSCECDPPKDKEGDDTVEGETFRVVPQTVQDERVVYIEKKPAVGFWAFFWGMLFGSLFFGC
jgi:hypothetical protein